MPLRTGIAAYIQAVQYRMGLPWRYYSMRYTGECGYTKPNIELYLGEFNG
jgi:hypothetical protein